jgi:2'-5' RNA ligase
MSAGSALVIRFPEIDRIVATYRLRLDPSARQGAPAHVTVHVPWVPAEDVDADALAAVRELAATVEPFDVSFESLRWFDRSVLWLEPTPAEPLRALARGSARRWPGYPLYGGQFVDVVPHLTIGSNGTADSFGDFQQAARELAECLPLPARAAELCWLAQGPDGEWRVRAVFALGQQH